MRTVLFVCTGNTCRSPMAEAIARHALDGGLLGGDEKVFVASAGVAAGHGVRTTPEAVAALAAMGIEFAGRSKPLTAEMIRKADLVLGMTDDHVQAARDLAGRADRDKVVRLDPAGDIEDPIGLYQSAYHELAEILARVIPARLQELLAHR